MSLSDIASLSEAEAVEMLETDNLGEQLTVLHFLVLQKQLGRVSRKKEEFNFQDKNWITSLIQPLNN